MSRCPRSSGAGVPGKAEHGTMLMPQTGAGLAAQPGSRVTSARPHGAKPPAGLALGRLGITQQRGALTRGEGGRLGAVAQQLRVHAPFARAGEAAGIDQAVGGGGRCGSAWHSPEASKARSARPAGGGQEQAGVTPSRMPDGGGGSAWVGRRQAGRRVSQSRRTGPPARRVGRGGGPRPFARRRCSAARAGAARLRLHCRCRPKLIARPCGPARLARRWPRSGCAL